MKAFKKLTDKEYRDEIVKFSLRPYMEIITELYTKQGNDYILVAKKENGKWRVI